MAEKYDWLKIAEQTVEVYRKAIGRRPSEMRFAETSSISRGKEGEGRGMKGGGTEVGCRMSEVRGQRGGTV